MRTIIPLPDLHAICGDPCDQQGRHGPGASSSLLPVLAGQGGAALPEGESASAAIDESPKARAMHEEIVGLIRAVRSRFG